TVNLVFHEDNGPDADDTRTAVANSSGNIAYNDFQVDIHDEGVSFHLFATGQSSGSNPYTTFVDSAANLDQCANGSTGTEPCLDTPTFPNWVNGNLGASKSHYDEGDSIPYRLAMTGLTAGTHTVTIEWDTTKAGKHALDYLTSWD